MSKLTRLSFVWRIVVIYVAASVAWKLFSILVAVLLADNTNALALWESVQGGTRIAITAAILYALLRYEDRQRQQVEENLRKQERDYHSLAENIPDIVTRFDRSLHCIFVNHQVEAASGLPRSRFLGKTLREFSQSPQAAEFGEKLLAQVIESGQAQTAEFFMATPVGLTHFEQRLIPEFGPAAEIQTVLSINRDITQRKQAENIIQESEKRFATLFHSNPTPIGITRRADNRILDVNAAWCALTGYAHDEAMGHTSAELGLARPETLQQVRDLLKAPGKIDNLEIPLYTRSGQERHVLISAELLELGGEACTLTTLLDITARQQAEQALRESEARFSSVFRHAPLAIAITQLKTNQFLDVNEAWQRITGLTREQAIGHTPFDLGVLVDPQARQRLNQVALAQGAAHDFEMQIRQQAGTVATLSLSVVQINLAGEPCLLTMATDITERKQTEQALQESRQRYRAVVEDQTELIVRFRADHTFLFVNDAYCRFYGKARAELLGKSWQPDAFPDDIPLIEAQLATLSPQHPFVQIENRVIAGSGEVRWMQFTNRGFFNAAGQLIEIQAVGRDITERKLAEDALRLSEQRFRQALENIPDVVVIYDPDLRIRYINSAARRLTGRTVEDFVGRRDDELWPPEIYSAYLPTLHQTLETHRPCTLVTELNLLGTSNRNLQITCVPLLDEADCVREIVGITHDFTELQRSAETLRQYAERLKVLHEVGRASLAGQLPQDIAQITLDLLQQLLPYQRGTITWIDSQTQDAVEIAKINDRVAEVRRQTDSLANLDEPRLTINMPLQSHNELIGTLNLQADRSTPFIAQDVEIAREAANELALAVQHAQLFEQVKTGRDRMERLSRRLLDVQETERRAIARELHDEIGQALTAVKIELQGVQRQFTGPEAEQLVDSIEIVDQALQQVRDLSLDLRPSLLDDLGLPAALRWYVDRQAQRAGLHAELNVDTVRERLEPNLETVCFRVIQEAVTNIIRHAHAQRIYVKLIRHDSQLLLTIQDDGRGFEVMGARAQATAGTSLGLLGMEERIWLSNGEIEIESTPGRGTTVRARLPFRKRDDQHD